MKKKIYLSGGMTGVDKDVSYKWRKDLSDAFKFWGGECFNPWDYWDFNTDVDEREIMNYDLYRLRESDLVIVNFTHNAHSIGTSIELGVAWERRIPILGYQKHGRFHAWHKSMCEKVFTDWEDLILYVKDYYLYG